MLNTFFIVGFLAIILPTVFTNNLNKQQSEAELKNDTKLNEIEIDINTIRNVCAHRRLLKPLTNKTMLICYNAYVDPEVDKIWKQFLKQKYYLLKRKIKLTSAMGKEDAVTERLKPLREKQNEVHVDRETASSINNATLQTQTFGIKNSSDLSNTSANGYQDIHLSRIERDNIMFFIAQVRNNSNIIKKAGFNDNEMLEIAKFVNGDYTIFEEKGQKKIMRRDNNEPKLTKEGKLMSMMNQLAPSSKGLKYERLREPYWQSGDYVFLRTGSPVTDLEKHDANPMEIFRDCDRSCNYYFETYGEVCGHRYNTFDWINEYRTFNNICDMDHENCVNPTVRPHWHPMYKGPCGELDTFYKPPFTDGWVPGVAKVYDNYSYTPRTSTDHTIDSIEEDIQKQMAQAEKDAEDAKKEAEMAKNHAG